MVAWQFASDGENSYSYWAAQQLRGRSRRARNGATGCPDRRARGPRRGRSGNAGAARGVPAGTRSAGMAQGRNVHIDFRSARANVDQMQALAKELIALQPDVILAHTTPVVVALQKETRAVPIVFVYVSDPVASGLVRALPGRAATSPVSPTWNSPWPANGWRCFGRSRRA